MDSQNAFDSDDLIGDFGFCVQNKSSELWSCTALHEGRETPIAYKRGRPA
jgi:hypothetical protein